MGGFGSGRLTGSGRDKVEACRSIDVNRLHREGCLCAGSMASCQWTRNGEKVASIDLRAEHDRLHLTYRVRIGGGEWEDVNETVRIVRMPCRFGGARPYFVCPGVVNGTACGRRVAKLHGPGRYFLCRHCYRLAHASQSEDAQRRSVRRANKIRQRLGGNAGMASPFPPKPKESAASGSGSTAVRFARRQTAASDAEWPRARMMCCPLSASKALATRGHSRRWSSWFEGREAHAVAVLGAMGIVGPANFPDDFAKNRGA